MWRHYVLAEVWYLFALGVFVVEAAAEIYSDVDKKELKCRKSLLEFTLSYYLVISNEKIISVRSRNLKFCREVWWNNDSMVNSVVVLVQLSRRQTQAERILQICYALRQVRKLSFFCLIVIGYQTYHEWCQDILNSGWVFAIGVAALKSNPKLCIVSIEMYINLIMFKYFQEGAV